jgi:hypothetical protein
VSIDSTNEDAFEALQQFADVWHDKYAKPASAGENRKPPSLTMRANGVAAVLTEPQMGAVVAEYVRMREQVVLDRFTLHGLLVTAYRNGWANRGQVVHETQSRADEQRGFFVEQFKDRANEWIAELAEADVEPRYLGDGHE